MHEDDRCCSCAGADEVAVAAAPSAPLSPYETALDTAAAADDAGALYLGTETDSEMGAASELEAGAE